MTKSDPQNLLSCCFILFRFVSGAVDVIFIHTGNSKLRLEVPMKRKKAPFIFVFETMKRIWLDAGLYVKGIWIYTGLYMKNLAGWSFE